MRVDWKGHLRLRNTYDHMMQRCNNKNSAAYPYYGGRGIRVCEEWANDPAAFLMWSLENGYDEELSGRENSLDRINNDGNYEPSNCRWVEHSVQMKNRRKPTFTEEGALRRMRTAHRPRKVWSIDGVNVDAVEFCKFFGKDYANVYARMRKYGLTPMQAILLPSARGWGANGDPVSYWKSLGLFDAGTESGAIVVSVDSKRPD